MSRRSSRRKAVRRRKLPGPRPEHSFLIRREKRGYRVFVNGHSLFYRNKRELLADEPIMHLLGQGTLYQFERRHKG